MTSARSFEQVLVLPVISEKSYASMASGRYVFRCHPSATKIQIGALSKRRSWIRRSPSSTSTRSSAWKEAPPFAGPDARDRPEPRLEEGDRDSRAGQKIEGLFEGV